MGKSQRYQAAVDGQVSRADHWRKSEKIGTTRASGAGIQAVTNDVRLLGTACVDRYHAAKGSKVILQWNEVPYGDFSFLRGIR